MRMIVVSDTHGNRSRLVELLDLIGGEGPFDLAIHLGDGYEDALMMEAILPIPLLGVRGNCDMVSTFPEERLEVMGGKRILLCHGHRYGVKGGLSTLERRGGEIGADLILYGHDHIPRIRETEGMLLVNPGAFVRSAHPPSLAIVTIGEGGISASHRILPQQPQPQL